MPYGQWLQVDLDRFLHKITGKNNASQRRTTLNPTLTPKSPIQDLTTSTAISLFNQNMAKDQAAHTLEDILGKDGKLILGVVDPRGCRSH